MTLNAGFGSHYIGAYVFNNLTLRGADLFCQDYLDIKGDTITIDGEILADTEYYLDLIPPSPPYVYPVSSPSSLEQTITIKGIKGAGNEIYLNRIRVVEATQEVFWQITYTLAEGSNTLSFTQKDSGGNYSTPVVKTVVYDEAPPMEVFPVADGKGDGTTITLSWQSYYEVSDLGYYKIYQSESPFTNVTAEGVILLGTTNRGVKTYTAKGLTQGKTYYFAVTGVDNKNNERTTITSAVSAAPLDTKAPEDVTNLKVTQCNIDSISVSWTPSKNSTGDLDHQSIHINGDVEGIKLGPEVTGYSGIKPASQELDRIDSVMVAVYDDKGNESEGTTIRNIPLLIPGPENIKTQSKISGIYLSWESKGEQVSGYNIYVQGAPFQGTVAGLTPKLSTTNLSAALSGLSNENTCYLTVTCINSLGFEDKTRFTVVSETPHSDQQGPQVTPFSFKADSATLINGLVLKYPTIFSLIATDETGIDRVTFTVDGKDLSTDQSDPYQSVTWNIVEEQDGEHRVGAILYDTLGNISEVVYTVAVNCAVPPAPVITSPSSGVVTQASQTITGTAQAGAQINLLLNNVLKTLDSVILAGADGSFSFDYTLKEGENSLRLSAKNRKGTSSLSNAVVLTYDTANPDPPKNLSAYLKEAGQVQLSWDAPQGESIKGYNVFRSINGGVQEKVNVSMVTATSFSDGAAAGDGLPCEYWVQAIDQANHLSDFSESITVVPDATGPHITRVDFKHRGPSDITKKPYIMGRGELEMNITVSEELSGTPFVNVISAGAKAIGISLTKMSKTTYFGSFEIDGSTPGGDAIITFSGRDMAGNRGTDVSAEYSSFKIDSQGPQMISLTLDPAPPINNLPQATVDFTFTLDDMPIDDPSVGDPNIFYQINEEEPIRISSLEAQGTDRLVWKGSFTLPSSAGGTPNTGDSLTISFQATDYLNNPGTTIIPDHKFEIYQGSLPTLSQPQNLTAKARPGRKVELSWLAIPKAAGYHIYRKLKTEDDSAFIRLNEDMITAITTTITFTDTAPSDGSYTYAVTTVREEGSATSESSRATVSVVADGTPPASPQNLTLSLEGYGVVASWDKVMDASSYILLRYSAEITSANKSKAAIIPPNVIESKAVDPSPSNEYPYYAVVSLDAAGNESAPSSSGYFNVDLLPLNNLTISQTIEQENYSVPVLTWKRPDNHDLKYNIYLEVEGKDVLLAGLIDGEIFADTGYDYKDRFYKVKVVDDKGTSATSDDLESIARELFFPVIEVSLPQGEADEAIYRGVINGLDINLANNSSRAIDITQINIDSNQDSHHYHYATDFVSLGAGEARTIPVVVGGEADWPDTLPFTAQLVMEPEYGSRIEISFDMQIPVKDRTYILSLSHDELKRGANTRVMLSLENNRDQEIEMVTAASTSSCSDEVKVQLIDVFGNILSESYLDERLGANVIATTSGKVVARIAPGGTYTSPEITLFVPLNTPDTVILRAEVEHLYHSLGQENEVSLYQYTPEPILVKETVSRLAETTYYVQVEESGKMIGGHKDEESGKIIEGQYQTMDEFVANDTVILKGVARSRETDNPMPYVPVVVGVKYKGYVERLNCFTDLEGVFTLEYPLRAGEGGSYQTWAYHPDMYYEYNQHSFNVRNLTITPYDITAHSRTNYQLEMPLRNWK